MEKENYKITLIRKPDVSDLAGEKVMIDFDSGRYFMLTGSANDIWDMLTDNADTDTIIRSLTEIYDVGADVCRESVLKFLDELTKIGFVKLGRV